MDVCREIREVSEVPVLVVTAKGEIDDRILGLHSGADDYLVKPYDVGELVARIHAVHRRRRVPAAADGASAAGSSRSATCTSTWTVTRSPSTASTSR